MITISSSGHLFIGLLKDLWRHTNYPIPALADLPPGMLEVVQDPLIPGDVEDIAPEDRGLVWVFMEGWTMLYGVVALEVFGNMDPRVIESGEMFHQRAADVRDPPGPHRRVAASGALGPPAADWLNSSVSRSGCRKGFRSGT